MLQFPLALGFMLVVAIGTVGYTIWSSGREREHRSYTYSNHRRPSDYDQFRRHARINTGVPDSHGNKLKRRKKGSVSDCCCICLDDFSMDANPVDPKPVKRLNCEHVFHSFCIAAWLEENNTCPICRKSL